MDLSAMVVAIMPGLSNCFGVGALYPTKIGWRCSTQNQKACQNALHKSGGKCVLFLTFLFDPFQLTANVSPKSPTNV